MILPEVVLQKIVCVKKYASRHRFFHVSKCFLSAPCGNPGDITISKLIFRLFSLPGILPDSCQENMPAA
jgi:hypothetical protein